MKIWRKRERQKANPSSRAEKQEDNQQVETVKVHHREREEGEREGKREGVICGSENWEGGGAE